MKKATILLKREEHEKIKSKVARILEKYDNFVLVELTDEQIASLQKEGFKVVVRTETKNIQLGQVTINTTSLRYDKKGAILAHPAYEHTNDPGPDKHHYIVRFIGPVKEEWKEKIEELGGILCDPLPSDAYIVEMDGQTRNEVIKLPFVGWLGHYDNSYRLGTNLLKEMKEIQDARSRPPAALSGEGVGDVIQPLKKVTAVPNAFLVSFHTRQNLDQALSEIRAVGAVIPDVPANGKTLAVSFPQNTPQIIEKLQDLAAIHGVRSIEALRISKLCNDVAIRIMTNSLGSVNSNLPLTGKGEIIAVADTGIDTGDQTTIHEDLRNQIVGIKSWPIRPIYDDRVNNPRGNDGAADVDSGHGTHVAGSVVGNGKKSKGLIRGLAYEAGLFFQAIEQKAEWKSIEDKEYRGDYDLVGKPDDDLTELFQEAYNAGARIHSDSWTGGSSGSYDYQSQAVDLFVWENKDMVILFAAGNDGRDGERNGKISQGSITPPATAKNCIAVGASENLRKDFPNTYANRSLWDFPFDPIASDKTADQPDDIAAFSSRGPCEDGRYKPDVVAPGTFILSTRSRLAKVKEEEGKGFLPQNDPKEPFYMYMSGSSMSTPLTAGAVALIRQYLRQKGLKPSASLVKAALINAALRKPYRYTAVTSTSDLWDFEQGWGHVNLKPFISNLPGFKMDFIEGEGLTTGKVKEYIYEVANTKVPIKVTLVYTDYPGNSVINNLNLFVTTPDGKDYHGNQFLPPFDSAFDTDNNVETVSILKPKKGKYKVTVLASDVSKGPQDFSLIISGGLKK